MVSIKTVAEECGVSIATVSKALNNHSDISETTKNFVCETAKRLGYMPNSQARALKTNKSYLIGVLLADKAGSGLTHIYFSAVLDSFKREMEKCGYDIVFISEKIGDRTMSFHEHCVYRNVDGVLATCVDFEGRSVQELIKSKVPLVAIDYQTDGLCSVVSDNECGMRDLVNYIYSQGHRRIAYICGDTSQVTDVRLKAYIDALELLGITPNENYIKNGKYLDDFSAKVLTKEFLQLHNPPTCIIYPDDYCALSGLGVLKKSGKTEGEISVAGYDGLITSQTASLSLTTVKQDTYNIGKKAANMLVRIINKEDIPKNEEVSVVRGLLISGRTVGKLP